MRSFNSADGAIYKKILVKKNVKKTKCFNFNEGVYFFLNLNKNISHAINNNKNNHKVIKKITLVASQ